jgi:GNAT superfamily N-acetyltransferase
VIVRMLDRHDSTSLAFLDQHGHTVVARRDELVDADLHPVAVAEQEGTIVGVLTYVIDGETCEILTLHAAEQWRGIGTALVVAVAGVAAREGCTRYSVTTTNDNVDALRFYQRRGFRIAAIRSGAVDRARQNLKPEIPLLGEYGIPLRDELELAQELPSPAASA